MTTAELALAQAAVALGWPVLFVGIAARGARGLWVLLGFLVAAYGGGLAVGALQPLDPVYLPGWTGMGASAGLLVLWAAYGAVARAAGGARMPGTPLFGAVLSGAVLGELAAAALVAAGASDQKSAARLALAASAGGLLGRVGDPAMLLLAERDPDMLFVLAPMALLCILILLPGGPLEAPKGRWSVSAVGAATALGAVLLGPHAWIALLLGMVGLAALAGRAGLKEIDWQLPVKTALIGGLIISAAAGGIPELIAEGLEFAQRLTGAALKPLVAAVSALAAAALDSTGAALLADATLDRARSLTTSGVAASMAAGIAVGSVGPLLVAGALREGWKLWLAQIGIAVLWAWLVL